jgi:hypothetical protein
MNAVRVAYFITSLGLLAASLHHIHHHPGEKDGISTASDQERRHLKPTPGISYNARIGNWSLRVQSKLSYNEHLKPSFQPSALEHQVNAKDDAYLLYAMV